MTSRSPSAVVATAALAVVLLAAAVQVQAARERAYPSVGSVTEDSLALTSASTVRRLTGAYNTLFADVYWIRSIQYYGGTRQREIGRAHV